MRELGPEDPRRIGPFAVIARLGSGAMGAVYLARSAGGRPLAVKVVHPHLAGDDEFRARFRREVSAARRVGGFWTAAVVDADLDAPAPWLATEYVAGPTLQAAVTEAGPLPEPTLRRLAAGLAEALTAIHATGLVHRDVKPSNVLLAVDGPRLIDFGIAHALDHTALTAVGTFCGTPGYTAPEQILGGEVGQAADVYSLGAVLVFAATGTGPLGSGSRTELFRRAAAGRADAGATPAALSPIVSACLATDPAARPRPNDVIAAVEAAGGVPEMASWLPERVHTMIATRVAPVEPVASAPASAWQRTRRYTEVAPAAAIRSGAGAPAAEQLPPFLSAARLPRAPSAPSAAPVRPAAPVQRTAGVQPAAQVRSTAGAQSAAGEPQATRVQPAPPAVGARPAAQVRPAAWVQSAAGAPPATRIQPASSAAASPATPGSEGTVFTADRRWAALRVGMCLLGMVVASGLSRGGGGAGPLGALLFFFCLWAGIAVAISVVRLPRRVEIDRAGVTVGHGRTRTLMPWEDIARIGVTRVSRRPWLVVWPTATAHSSVLHARFRLHHGGYGVQRMAPWRGGGARDAEVHELRAALGWYAGTRFDPRL